MVERLRTKHPTLYVWTNLHVIIPVVVYRLFLDTISYDDNLFPFFVSGPETSRKLDSIL